MVARPRLPYVVLFSLGDRSIQSPKREQFAYK
jgi:hypothetical protein